MTRREWSILLYLLTVVIGVAAITDFFVNRHDRNRPETPIINSVEG